MSEPVLELVQCPQCKRIGLYIFSKKARRSPRMQLCADCSNKAAKEVA